MLYLRNTPETPCDGSRIAFGHPRRKWSESPVASYRSELEKRSDGIPNLDEVESGKLVGAILPMSERAQTQLRDSIEVIDYLLNQESVVWS
jgi:hypothetical protein